MTAYRLLLVGAGYTGRRLLERLPADGAVAVNRSRPRAASQRVIEADLDHEVPVLPAAEVIVYTVPPARAATPDPRLQHLFDGIQVPPRRFVYFSTSGVYGNRDGELVDETATPQPATARAKRRLAAESLLTTWCTGHGVELSILRVPGIYGPGRVRLDSLAAGEPILRDADAPPANRIHVDDLVSCALAAADLARPAGIYNVGDGNYRSSSWFIRTVAELASLPQPPELSLDAAEKTFSERRLSFLREARRLDVRRMHDVLGVELQYADARDGIRASLPDEVVN